MRKITPYMQYNSALWMLIVVLGIYSAIMTYFAVRNIPTFKVVAIEPTGTRLITDQKDKAIEFERQQFVKKFIRSFTNYDADSIIEITNQYTSLMTEEFWKKYQPNFQVEMTKIKEARISQNSTITKLEQSDKDPFSYTATVETLQFYRGSTKKLQGVIQLNIKATRRTEYNPSGFEVDNLQENWTEVSK